MPQVGNKKYPYTKEGIQQAKEAQGKAESLSFEFADKYKDLIQRHSKNALSGKTDNYSTRFGSGPSGYNDFIRIALSQLPEDKRNKVNNLDDLFFIHGTKFTENAWREIHEQMNPQQKISKGQKDANDWIKDHGVEDYALGQTRLGVEPFAFMSKKHIAEYQKLMQKRGFYTGKIDSIPGPQTRDAHKRMITGTPIKPLKDVIVDFMKEKIK